VLERTVVATRRTRKPPRTSAPPKLDRSEERRRRLLTAATELFHRYGFRRTSMDLLAEEAGLAKATLYAYYDDKDAVFRAVVEDVLERILARATLAAAAEGSLTERLTAMLDAKIVHVFELVERSPHAKDIVEAQNLLSGELVERADRAYLRLVTRVLESAVEDRTLDLERSGLSPPAAAALLVRAAHGAQADARTAAAVRRNLAEIVRVVVRGLGARP
jgi:AcrR family transcriptional regulator